MKFKIYKRHWLFSIVYFVSLEILLLNQINELPMADILRKVKYPYVFFIFVLVIFNARVKRGIKAALLVMTLYIAHAVLFGYVFVNDLVATHIVDNASQMIWYLLFVLVTFLYVSQNNFFKGFINLSFYACGLQLFIGLIHHRNNIVNPLWALVHAFTADIRFKNSFGFVHAGYTANAAFLVLVLSLFFFEIYRGTENFKKLWFWASFLAIDAVAGLELCAAAERSGILSTAIVFAVYIVFVLLRIRIEKKTLLGFVLIGIIVIVALEASGTFQEIWGKSNRDLNITVNYPLFKAYGSPWTGLGFVENAAFHADRNLFPMATSSLDMYYVYIYFSTGLLGSLMIGLALLTITVKLLINKRTGLNILAIGFWLAMLFFAFWQSNMFTHRYISSYVISTIILCTMSNDCCLGEDECTSTELTA
ncbi:MAG: hypothetical protein IK018_10355 [Lachnospiraceae bacterium]|nr:hypothetical protein [Lachnospiraceae bacterium]